MNDFEYDVMQRASVARSARCKVASVRGPKGCSLMAILGTMPIPEGKCTIRIEVVKV